MHHGDSMTSGIVYFATKYGSTEEIAQTIADRLGFDIKNVMYVEDETELDKYDTIILGTPIYFDDIYQDMKHFVQTFFIKLGGKKLITFAVNGATKGYMDTDYAQKFANYFDPKPAMSVAFLGRATKETLGEDDYKKLYIFFKYRLRTKFEEFDYFDENKIDVVVDKIKELIS
jgi:menaquinone-dependent protoporphyrinogen IX oxidase